jgi:hypothetical protein
MNYNMTNWKHRIALLGVLIAIATTAWTQEIKWSEKYEMSSIFNENDIVQTSTDGFYVLQNYKNADYYYQQNIGFYTFDFEKKEGAKPMEFLYKNLKGTYQFALSKGTAPYVAYSVNDIEGQKEMLLINGVESSTLGLGDIPVKVLEIAYKDKIKPKEDYRYCASPDGSKLLFYGQMPYEKKGKGTIGLFLVDGKFGALGHGVAELNQEGKILTVNDVVDAIVDNKGRTYLLCKIYKGKDKKEEKKLGTRFVYSLVEMDYSSNSTVQVLDTIKVLSPQDSAIIVSAKLSINSSGEIRCLGTYKLPRKKAGLFSIDAQKAFSEMPVVMDYPEEVLALEAKMPRKVKKKKHLSLKNYKIKSIFEQVDGTQIIVAEQHYINAYWDKSEGRQEQHKLNNLFVAKINDHKIEWAKVLSKRQKAGAEGYSDVPHKLYSFYAFQKAGEINVLYNEIKENLTITDEFKLEKAYYNKPKDCYLVHCKIDMSSGDLKSKESVLGLKDDGIAVYPKETKVLSDGSLLLFGVKPEYSLKELSYIRFGHWVLD